MKSNIIFKSKFYFLVFINNFKLTFNSITKDNANSNNVLINIFRLYYNYKNIKFDSDILYTVYILNFIIQNILKAFIKDDYNLLNNNNSF